MRFLRGAREAGMFKGVMGGMRCGTGRCTIWRLGLGRLAEVNNNGVSAWVAGTGRTYWMEGRAGWRLGWAMRYRAMREEEL